jgi:hypothetical protein
LLEASARVALERAEEAAAALAALSAAGTATAQGGSSATTGRLLASILVDAERLVHEVDIVSGAHRAAVSEDLPDA